MKPPYNIEGVIDGTNRAPWVSTCIYGKFAYES
jgi:hypothetical protein